ncbi:MAG: sugar ABC transporter permease [Bacilli bacterium]|nr:sugar ABC transporter permease [Bacilli bacterium]
MSEATLERASNPFYSAKKFYHSHKKVIGKHFFVFSFLALPIFLFCIFYIYVNLESFVMAFKAVGTLSDGTVGEYWTLDNFKTIGQILSPNSDGVGILTEAIINTLLFNFVNICLLLPTTTIVTYFITKKIFGYRFFRATFYLPCIITSSALVALFKVALHDAGPLDVLFRDMGYVYPLSEEGTAILTILIYNFLFGIGGNLIVLGGAMRAVDPQMLEAGQIDGCNWFQEFIYIILPSIWPTISTILILSAAGFLGASGPILPFTRGEYGTMTLAYYTFSLVSGTSGQTDYYLASAIGLCMTAISFPLAMVVKKVVYGKNS